MLPKLRLDCGTDFDCTSTTTLTGGSKTTTLTPFVTRQICADLLMMSTPQEHPIFGNYLEMIHSGRHSNGQYIPHVNLGGGLKHFFFHPYLGK